MLALFMLPLSAHADCSNPPAPESTVIYNEAFNSMQFCDGARWIAMGDINPSAGGGSCSSPNMPEASVVYNQDYKVMQFCNGTDWIAMSAPQRNNVCDIVASNCLLGRWRMNEGSGNTVADSSGYNFNGTRNGATWVAGHSGQALSFNGTSDYVDITYSSAMNFIDNFTLAAWINPSATTSLRRIITLPADGPTGTEQYSLLINAGNLEFWVGNNGPLSTPYTPGTGTWHHVAATIAGPLSTLYIDGVQVAQSSTGGNSRYFHALGNMAIGRFSATFPQVFSGSLDDVRIYTHPLSAAQIAVLAADGEP